MSFSFLACNLHNSHDFKLFWNKQKLNSVIPNDGIYGINSCKNKRVLAGAPHMCFMIDLLIDWLNYHAWLILFCSMTCSKLFFNCALTSFFDKLIVARRPGNIFILILVFLYACFDSHMCMIVPGIHWFSSSIVMSTSFY